MRTHSNTFTREEQELFETIFWDDFWFGDQGEGGGRHAKTFLNIWKEQNKILLEGSTIEEMVGNYFETIEEQIVDEIDEAEAKSIR